MPGKRCRVHFARCAQRTRVGQGLPASGLSSGSAAAAGPGQRVTGGGSEPDSDERTAAGGGNVVRSDFHANTEMKAAGREVGMTADKLNGDLQRRPSYPGELRAKHANMSTKIWVKVAMAIAYFLCVSVAAFVLVIYYVFVWTPEKSSNISSTEAPNRTECSPRWG